MVETQLRARRIRDERVLEAMSIVPREEFVASVDRHRAYDDRPLPIGRGQTISQPFTVAYMCQALRLRGTENVLEIGTGCGYGAAVLSLLSEQVSTIERLPTLAAAARERLQRLGYTNVHVELGDGTLGLPDRAPFDGIVVTAAASAVPWSYLEQLAERGRLVIPVGESFAGQTLYRFTRERGRLLVEELGGFCFVPLVGEYGEVFGDPRVHGSPSGASGGTTEGRGRADWRGGGLLMAPHANREPESPEIPPEKPPDFPPEIPPGTPPERPPESPPEAPPVPTPERPDAPPEEVPPRGPPEAPREPPREPSRTPAEEPYRPRPEEVPPHSPPESPSRWQWQGDAPSRTLRDVQGARSHDFDYRGFEAGTDRSSGFEGGRT